MYVLVLLLSFLTFAPVLASAGEVEFKNYPSQIESYSFNANEYSKPRRSKREFYGETVEFVIDHGFTEDKHESITKKFIHDDDGHFYQVTKNARVNRTRDRKTVLSGATASQALGTKRTLVVPVGDPEVSGSSFIYTPEALGRLYFSNVETSLNTYYREVSSNRAAFSGSITNVLGISGLCEGGDIFVNGAAEFLMNLVNDQIDLSAYDRVSFVLPDDDHCMAGALGVGILGNFAYVNSLNKAVRISFNWNVSAGASTGNTDYFMKVIAHEFGHNFGLKHDNGNSCGDKVFETAECDSFEYGGVHSIMGYSPNLAHVNAIQKKDLEWFTGNEMEIIDNDSFAGEFTLSPLASAATNTLKAVKIRRADGSYYVIEYHRPIGMEAVHFENDVLNYAGVQIYLNNDSFSRDSILLRNDFAEVSISDGFQVFDLRDRASFGTSDGFYDPISDISITTLSVTSESARILIEKNIPELPPEEEPDEEEETEEEGGGTSSSVDPYLHTNFDSLTLNSKGVTKTDLGIVFNGDVLTSDTLLIIKIPKAYKKLIKISKKNRRTLFVDNIADVKVKLAPLKKFEKKLGENESSQFEISITAKVIDKVSKEIILEQDVTIGLDSGE